MRRVAIGQAGGPTAVLNTSLIGFLDALDGEVFGVLNGFQGLVDGDMIFIDENRRKQISQFNYVPGACLGAGRYQMDYDSRINALKRLHEKRIDTLVFIGGNGTMTALHQLHQTASDIGYDLSVIGIPKTVDNDLAETDHAPGFASAARYVALSTRDISKDLEAMRNFEQVRIIETMGRNAGWLAAASGLLKKNDTDGPHKIYIPEKIVSAETFLKDIKKVVGELGFATVVVSEGLSVHKNSTVEKATVNGRKVLGGISNHLAELVYEELGLTARGELLGMNQRSSQLAISEQDQAEAYDVGKKAGNLVEEECSNVMVSLGRSGGESYEFRTNTVPIEKVSAGGEQRLPRKYIDDPHLYYEWLKPLVGSDLKPFPPMIKRGAIDENKPIRS